MAYMDNSYSNSNNGGSVNSQDSLWQVKANGELQQQQQQVPRQYSYDPLAHGGYVDDYGHYPPAGDEYLNQRNRDYMAAGDPYGPVHKPKKRMDHLGRFHNKIVNI
jgi:echinoid protein